MDKDRIVVMGGSFNPPTIAHLNLMEAAMQAIHADKGIFVPVSQACLKRKMRERGASGFSIDLDMRLKMLKVMTKDNPALCISESQCRSVIFRTNQMLMEIQHEYNDADVYFLAGTDKLPLIAEWCEKYDFQKCFYVVLFSREESDSEVFVMNDKRLCQHSERLILLSAPPELEGISSTMVRNCLADGRPNDAAPYLHRDVFELLLTLKPCQLKKEIEQFKGNYYFLDNCFPASFQWEGHTWKCAESAIAAARCGNADDAEFFAACDGKTAKKHGGKKQERDDWKTVRLDVVEEILTAKFSQNEYLKERLRRTGDTVLVAGHNGKESFWGRNLYSDKGENHLGKILMKIRDNFNDRTR